MKYLYPPQGTPDTLIDRLLAYVTPYDADFATRIQGASDEEITDYCLQAGYENPEALPKAYHVFLKAMGDNDGGIFDTCDIGIFNEFQLETGLDVIWEMYADKPVPEGLKPRFAYVADTIKTMFYDSIALDRHSKWADPPVVITNFIYDEATKNIRFHAQSWTHFLMQSAVLYVASRRFPVVQWYHAPTEYKLSKPAFEAAIDQLLTNLKLTLRWPGDARHYIAIGEDISLFIDTAMRETMCFTSSETFLQPVDRFVSVAIGSVGKRLKLHENGLLYGV